MPSSFSVFTSSSSLLSFNVHFLHFLLSSRPWGQMRLVTTLSSLSKFHLSSPLLLFCLFLWDYPKLWQCNSSFLLLLLILSPAVLFNPINDHVFSCLLPPSICSSPPWHSTEVSPFCPSPCFYVLYDRLQRNLSSFLHFPHHPLPVPFSDGTWINQTRQSVKILPSSILCIDFFPPSLPFPPPMDSLFHSPLLPVICHHIYRTRTLSKHDKVWEPTYTLHSHTLPPVSTYWPMFHLQTRSQTLFPN